jgi:ABC-type transport system involved in multi-copper enzyme maturation permease subunit
VVAALSYEWTRIRTVRSTWWLSAIALVFGIGLSFVAALGTSMAFDSGSPPSASDMHTMGPGIATQFSFFGAPYFVAYILAMVGVFAWGHEYRHGMIRATLTALSSRTGAWAAKFLVVGVWVLGIALVTMAGATVVGWLWLHDNGIHFFTSDVGWAIVRTLGYTLVFTLIATAFTALIRNQTAALVLLFLWPLAIENVITLLFQVVPGLRDHVGLTRFLPFNAGDRIIDRLQIGHGLFGDPLSLWGGIIIFGGITLVAMVLSLVLFRSRDA